MDFVIVVTASLEDEFKENLAVQLRQASLSPTRRVFRPWILSQSLEQQRGQWCNPYRCPEPTRADGIFESHNTCSSLKENAELRIEKSPVCGEKKARYLFGRVLGSNNPATFQAPLFNLVEPRC